MLRIVLFCVVTLLFSNTHGMAQDLSSYKWKNRLLLVLTEDVNHHIFKSQLKELQNNTATLEDLKLQTIIITPKTFKIGLNLSSEWIPSAQLFKDYSKPNITFEVLLIGLDGSIKSRRSKLFTANELKTLINTMPMRQAEIKNKG